MTGAIIVHFGQYVTICVCYKNCQILWSLWFGWRLDGHDSYSDFSVRTTCDAAIHAAKVVKFCVHRGLDVLGGLLKQILVVWRFAMGARYVETLLRYKYFINNVSVYGVTSILIRQYEHACLYWLVGENLSRLVRHVEPLLRYKYFINSATHTLLHPFWSTIWTCMSVLTGWRKSSRVLFAMSSRCSVKYFMNSIPSILIRQQYTQTNMTKNSVKMQSFAKFWQLYLKKTNVISFMVSLSDSDARQSLWFFVQIYLREDMHNVDNTRQNTILSIIDIILYSSYVK